MKKILLLLFTGIFFTSTAFAQKTLVFCSEGSPEGFYPALYTAGTTFDASSRTIYNRLVEFARGTTDIRAALANNWHVSEDGMKITFRLRKGVKFHTTKYFTPSRDMNADDVIFSFMRQLDPDHPYHKVSSGSYEYFNGMGMQSLIKKIEKTNDHTVQFYLSRPEAPIIANMAMDFASIVSAEYAQEMMDAGTPELFDQRPIGSGPFKFLAYQKDAFIRYRAHEGYWKANHLSITSYSPLRPMHQSVIKS